MENKIYVIIESAENIAREADIFFSARDAGEFLQRKTNDLAVGFRNKRDDESWEKYLCAWDFHSISSDSAILKTGAWNIAWFETDSVHWPNNIVYDHVYSALKNLYYAVMNHANVDTLDQGEIINALKEARVFLSNRSNE